MPKGIPKNGINKGWIKKGETPWNKDSKGVMKAWNKGKKTPEEAKAKMRMVKRTKEQKEHFSKLFTGRKLTEEHCKNISEANKKKVYRKLTSEEKKRISSFLSKRPHTKEANEKRRIAQLKRVAEGKHNNYYQDRTKLKVDSERGGHAPAERDWSIRVKRRDGWKCQLKNDKCSGRLEAHHIEAWRNSPELRFEISNGITLCHAHHPRKRKIEERLKNYFKNIINKKSIQNEWF